MNDKIFRSPVLALGVLCLLLLLDGTGILRLAILASLVHESGHCLVYYLQTKKIPCVSLELAGISLQAQRLHQSRTKQTLLLLAGPAANFIACGILICLIQYQATYGRYFFLAANLFAGCYNLLPLSALDGGRLIRLWLAEKFEGVAIFLQWAIAVGMLLWVVYKTIHQEMPIWMSVALIPIFIALAWKSYWQRD